MSVIKTLDASENNDEREKEKLKIEKEFKKSDKRLQELVTKHDSDLTKVSDYCWMLINKIVHTCALNLSHQKKIQ